MTQDARLSIILVQFSGATEMRDMNLRHLLAWVEFVGHENAGPISRGGK